MERRLYPFCFPLRLCATALLASFLGAGASSEDKIEWSPEEVNFDRTPIHYVWQGPDQSVYAGGGRDENYLLRWQDSGWEILAPIEGRIYFGFTSSDGTLWFLTRTYRDRSIGGIQGLWRWQAGSAAPEPVPGFEAEAFSISRDRTHFHAVEDAQGRILLSTVSRLVIYVIEEGRFREWHCIEATQEDAHRGRYLYLSRLANGRIVGVPSHFNFFSGYVVIDGSQIQTFALPDFDEPRFDTSRLILIRSDPEGPVYRTWSDSLLQLNIEAQAFNYLGKWPSAKETTFLPVWKKEGDTQWILSSRWHFAEKEPGINQIQLWQRIGEGDWEPLGDWLDFGFPLRGERTTGDLFVSHGNKIWIGTSTLGVIGIERDSGEARYLNWRHGFPVNDASTLFALPNGRIWAGRTNASQGSGAFDPAKIRAQEQADKRILSFPDYVSDYSNIRWPSVQTEDKTIYEIRTLKDGNENRVGLRKWTGRSWETLILKDFISSPGSHALLADKHHRLWVVEVRRDEKPKMARIIDGKTMAPLILGNFEELLVAYAKEENDPGFFPGFFPVTYFSRNTYLPYISPQGQILYHDHENLHAYNGQNWGKVLRSNISEHYRDTRHNPFGYMVDCGHAAMRIDSNTYKLTTEGRWVATEAPYVLVQHRSTLQVLHPARMQSLRILESFDNLAECRIWQLGEGRYWMHCENRLAYFIYEDWKVPIIPNAGADPLLTRDILTTYYSDAEDQHLLLFGTNWWVFPAHKAGVPPQVSATQPSWDSMLLTASQSDQVTAWRWRLNGGEWSEPARQETILAHNLLPGHHRVELQSLSLGLLWMDAQPIDFEIDYDMPLLLTNALEDLLSKDWDKRHLAIRLLAMNPENAPPLPPLEAHSMLNEEDRWWLEVAHQKVDKRPAISNRISIP